MKYEYGVTYTTNCKKPDLPDGIVVEQFFNGGWHSLIKPVEKFESWRKVTAFRIVDGRYMSEGKSNALTSETSLTHNWHARGELPPVGTVCEVYNHEFAKDAAWEKCTILFMGKFKCVYSSESCHERVGNVDLTGAIEFRPIRTEREKAINAAIDCIPEIDGVRTIAGRLFDAGLLRLPEGK